MAVGFGDWNPNLHPRGWHGRFIKKFKLAPWLDRVLKSSRVRTFQTDSQAAQFNFNNNSSTRPGGRFTELDFRRIRADWDEAADHIRAGDIDPTTQRWLDTVNSRMTPTKEGLIVGRTFTPEALGLSPQQMNENDPNGIIRMTGNTITDKAPSPVHLGSDMSHGAGKITMRIAVPEGVPVAHLGENRNDRGMFLGGNQKLLVTRVYPDGSGGWYMTAVAEPPGAQQGRVPGVMKHDIVGRKGANLTPAQREARIGGSTGMPQPAEPPSAAVRQVEIARDFQQPGVRSVEPGPPQKMTPAKKVAKAARQAGYKQALANEQQQINQPAPVAAPPPQAVTPTPAPAPPAGPGGAPGVGERTEPVHGPIGGIPTGGKSASEIAATPPEAPPAPAAPAPKEFTDVFRESGLKSPSAGPQRREFNNALMGIKSGKTSPEDALRELDSDLDANRARLKAMPDNDPKAKELRDNIQHQANLADLIATHFNEPRLHRTPEATPAEGPDTSAPAKKAFSTVKELTPEQRTHYDSLDRAGRARYLARRRAGQEHGAAFEASKNAPGKREVVGKNPAFVPQPMNAREKAAAAKAAAKGPQHAPGHVEALEATSPEQRRRIKAAGGTIPEDKIPAPRTSQTEKNAAAAARRAETGELKPTVSAARVQAGDVVLAKKNDKGEWQHVRLKTGATPVTVTGKEKGPSGHVISGTGPDGEKITLNPIPGGNVLTRHKERAPRATKAAKAVPEKAPAAAKAAPAKVTKAAKAAPATKAVSEVQTRADEAGLPKTVTALRGAAREKKIRGFSTMTKEQLQRALLGEEVGTGGKLGAIAPDKLTPHLESASSGQEARALLEDHTVADLKALAKANGVDLKGITTKERIKDAILKHIRGTEASGIPAVKPEKSLAEDVKGIKAVGEADRIMNDVSPDDPDSLRSHRDQLEQLADRLDAENNPTDAGRARKLADALGMRAQMISGEEEAPPTAKKAVKAVKKAAAPKLSVHQERVRKQALADGATEEEARAAGEAAPTRAPAGTKALSKKAAAAAKAAGLPESRAEGAPGPKLTAPRRAAKVTATPVARDTLGGPTGQLHEGALGPNLTPQQKLEALGGPKPRPPVPTRGRSREEVLRQRELGGAQLAPDDAEIKRVLREQTETPISREEADGLLRGLTKARLMNQADGLNIPRARTLTKDQLRREIVDATVGRKIDSIATRGFTEARPGSINEPPSAEQIATQARLQPAKVAKEAVAKAEKAHPEVPTPVVKATRARVAKAVPDGSVGTRGVEPIDNKARASEFDQAWEKARIPRAPDKTSQGTISEVRQRVSSGEISPEEGIRRLETDISMNQDEIDDINRVLRSDQAAPDEENGLRLQRDKLIKSKAAQEDAARFMHQHFGKERVTPEEVKIKIEGVKPGFWDSLNKQDPEILRHELENDPGLKHIGPLKGDTSQEIFQDALKKIIKTELDKKVAAREARAAKKAVPKAVPRAARAVPEPSPDFAPGGAKHLDAKAIGEGLDVDSDILDRAQADLNAGKTPGMVAKDLEQTAQARKTRNVYQHGGWHDKPPLPGEPPEVTAGRKARADSDKAIYDKELAKADQIQELANRLKTTRRPVAKRTPAKAAAESITEAKKATKEPAARKELAKAEAAVKEAGDEADKLKQRVLKRHVDAWDASTTRAEAEKAASDMRGDLLLSEIRDWAKPMGITGRSKEDILKKAVERRFGHGGDIIGGENKPGLRPAAARVNSRMEAGQRVKRIGAALSDVDELLNSKASERAMSHRVRGSELGGSDPELAQRIERAALAGDRNELDKIASEHGLVRNTGPSGTVEPFEPGKHRGLGRSGFSKGDAVQVISPGYQGTVEGRAFQAHPAGVLEATPEQKTAMLERLGKERKEAIRNLPVQTRAAVLQRLSRGPGETARARKIAPAKVAVAELPTNKEEEVAQNLARLKAAKAVPAAGKFSPDTTAADLAKATSIDEGRQIIARAQTKADLQKLADKVGFEHKPGHTKAQLQEGLLRRTVTTRLEHAAYVGLGDRQIPAKKAAPAKATSSIPDTAPVRHAYARFDENTSPATFGRGADLKAPNGSWSSDQGLIHMDSEIGQLWNDLAKDSRTSTPDLNKIAVIGQDLGQGRIDLPTARALIREIKPGGAGLRDRINKAVADLDVKPSKVDLPDNTPKAVRDLLDKLNEIPAFHNKGSLSRGASGPTPFEEIQKLVRDIGNGDEGPGGDMKLLRAVENPHESGDGVYQARRDGAKVLFHSNQSPEVRNWFRSWRNKEQAPSAPEPAKATPAPAKRALTTAGRESPGALPPLHTNKPAKKAAKAAPKVTQAELRTPVAKAGSEAPAAPAKAVKATGLTPGEGIPVSNRLALENKLGTKKANLNALDRAVRAEATRAKVPELLAKVNVELAQAGIGPNDEPRKSLNEWYHKHFS